LNKLLTFTGFIFLLMAAYLDNTRGPLLPIFNQVLNLQYGKSSLLLSVGYLSALFTLVILTISSKKISDKSFALFFSILSLLLCFFSKFVTNFYCFILFAAMLGSAIAGFGVISNIFVIRGTTPKFHSRSLAALHTMYGLGSSIAPIVVGWIWKYSGKFQVVYYVFIPIVLFTIFLIKKTKSLSVNITEKRRLNNVQILIVILFAIYVAGEVTTSMWLVPYLVSGCGIEISHATKYASLLFVVMAFSRFLFFLFPFFEKTVLCGSVLLSAFFLFLGRNGFFWCFPLVGVFGPFFPLLLSRVSKNFPLESRYLTFIILTVIQLILSINQLFLGRLTDYWGISKSYSIPFYILIVAFLISVFYLFVERKGKII